MTVRVGRLARLVAFLGVAAACPAYAQRLPALVTVHTGIANPADAYQSNCGHSSIALGADVQGRGRLFPQLSASHFTGSGGGDVLCIRFTRDLKTVGGLRLENATRAGVGGGVRVGRGALQLEGAVTAGVITGRRGYVNVSSDDTRVTAPHMAARGALVVAHHVVLSLDGGWTRLTRHADTDAQLARSTSWSPLVTMQVGVRFGR
ncbi:MAG: hypothetical protein LCH84_14355 [Gemmatimonadetes bacterium]|nr:hypothetical protein [Gemmatimonadota bacterium]